MKKFTILIVAVFMIFSLAACSQDVTAGEKQYSDENTNKEGELKVEVFEDIKGKIKGFGSANSIEIVLEGVEESIDLEYPEDLSKVVKELTKGDKILFSYVKMMEKSGELTDIKKIVEEPKLPEKKTIELFLEGMAEEREVSLMESKYGYYIYLLDGFTFKEVEDGKAQVIMNYDNDFYIEIEVLPKDLNYDEWAEAIKVELGEFGEVHEIKPDEHFDSYFHDAYYYYLSYEANKGSIMCMLKEIDGKLFQFKINMPHREAAEGAGPSFWAMLKTIQVK